MSPTNSSVQPSGPKEEEEEEEGEKERERERERGREREGVREIACSSFKTWVWGQSSLVNRVTLDAKLFCCIYTNWGHVDRYKIWRDSN